MQHFGHVFHYGSGGISEKGAILSLERCIVNFTNWESLFLDLRIWYLLGSPLAAAKAADTLPGVQRKHDII